MRCFQNYRETRIPPSPRTTSITADANLHCAFDENALFLHQSLIVKIRQNIVELVTRPGGQHLDGAVLGEEVLGNLGDLGVSVGAVRDLRHMVQTDAFGLEKRRRKFAI